MNIFVVDSHPIYRRGLVASLELLDGVAAVEEAGSVAAARKDPAFASADVVIVDPSIDGGEEFLVAVAAEAAGPRVIACTANCDEEAVRAALEAGVVGYLRRDTLTSDMLQAALTAARSGAAVVAPGLLAGTLRERPTSVRRNGGRQGPIAPPLSEREQRVLTLIADGHPTREIATELCYSERTVKNVLHDVVTKLNARSRSHAIAHAVRGGLI